MKERITLQELVALNNTPKAKALVIKYGYSPAKNYDDLIYKLFRFTKEYQEDALRELAELHPHKDLILQYNCKPMATDKKLEAPCQCPNCRMKRGEGTFSNADGSNFKLETMKEWLPMVAIVGIVSAILVTAIKN